MAITEAQAAILVAARLNHPAGAAAGNAARIPALAAQVQAWFDTGLNGPTVPVTFTDSGDLVNATAHGFANGTPVEFLTIVSTTGIAVNTEYYVVSTAANTFQVSLTVGGAAIALTTDGSGTVVKKSATSANAVLALEAASQSDVNYANVLQVTNYAASFVSQLP